MRTVLVSVVVGLTLLGCAAPAPPPTALPTRLPTAAPAPTQPPPTATPLPQPTARPTVSGKVPIGTVTRMTSGANSIHAAVDVAGATEWWNFALANNQRAMREMIAQETVFPVAEGTRLEVLQHDGLYTLVKVLEGPHAGREGWIRTAYIP